MENFIIGTISVLSALCAAYLFVVELLGSYVTLRFGAEGWEFIGSKAFARAFLNWKIEQANEEKKAEQPQPLAEMSSTV